MSTWREYTSQIRRQLKLQAIWLPNTPLGLGDFGRVADGVFQPTGSVKDIGIEFETTEGTSQPTLQLTTRNGVQISAAGAAAAPAAGGPVQIETNIRFTREGAMVFAARGCRVSKIRRVDELAERLWTAHDEDRFDTNLVVVTTVLTAESATILVGSGTQSSVTLNSAAALSNLPLDLARAELGVAIAYSTNMAATIIAENDLTPLFSGIRLRKDWRRRRRYGFRGLRVGGTTYEDFDYRTT